MQGPLRLEAGAVSATSPDGKFLFQAKSDGTAQLVETRTGQVLQTRNISVEDYRRVEAKWQDNQRVAVTGHIRYPAMATQLEYLWDRKSGTVTDRWSGDARDFKLP